MVTNLYKVQGFDKLAKRKGYGYKRKNRKVEGTVKDTSK